MRKVLSGIFSFVFCCCIAMPAFSNCSSGSNGCANDENLPYSCGDMTVSTLGGNTVFNATAGCVARNGTSNGLNGTGYGIMNSNSWADSYVGYARFCYCEENGCTGIVNVYPCGAGNTSTDCVIGYHWESGRGCVVDVTCSDCESEGWTAYSTGYQRKTTATCDVTNGTCTKTYSYRCAAGYYGSSTNGSSGCTRCTTTSSTYTTSALSTKVRGTSAAGSTAQTSCYVGTGTYYDASGTVSLSSSCSYSSSGTASL